MNPLKDIEPRNADGKKHGYHEVYWGDSVIYKATFVNGKTYGYHEWGSGIKTFYLK